MGRRKMRRKLGARFGGSGQMRRTNRMRKPYEPTKKENCEDVQVYPTETPLWAGCSSTNQQLGNTKVKCRKFEKMRWVALLMTVVLPESK
ncbi:predicted protein [Sclerotinia sclerotiorum 1980 UF-70]|uniref:Uncharacterized protein n=1 Tax=Sclerotinia sclerotiorum (strain ATCC 18683 / 1980 / Ss-1) TaxID=665079 RepID=A7E6Z3_SCLS1|nr:predicted protein [Sclerotinia sclerotiorum 1980 UF-70]EDN91665.1 predicted protein [Sclerotinia sclerotiorum 1980 UF-70]